MNLRDKMKTMDQKQLREYLIKKLMHKIVKAENGCWLFQGKINKSGYGEMFLYVNKSGKSRYIRANRLSYILFIGKLKRGMFICHKCNNPRCCNPKHLYQGTPQENMTDKVNANRQYITWGERSGVHKLTTQEVREIRASNARQIDLAHKYGVAKSTICEIVNGTSRCYE